MFFYIFILQSDNGAKAINESADYPDIRLFTAELDCESTPQMELKKVRQPWSRASPGLFLKIV